MSSMSVIYDPGPPHVCDLETPWEINVIAQCYQCLQHWVTLKGKTEEGLAILSWRKISHRKVKRLLKKYQG